MELNAIDIDTIPSIDCSRDYLQFSLALLFPCLFSSLKEEIVYAVVGAICIIISCQEVYWFQ